jgi:hypothetical protein
MEELLYSKRSIAIAQQVYTEEKPSIYQFLRVSIISVLQLATTRYEAAKRGSRMAAAVLGCGKEVCKMSCEGDFYRRMHVDSKEA